MWRLVTLLVPVWTVAVAGCAPADRADPPDRAAAPVTAPPSVQPVAQPPPEAAGEAVCGGLVAADRCGELPAEPAPGQIALLREVRDSSGVPVATPGLLLASADRACALADEVGDGGGAYLARVRELAEQADGMESLDISLLGPIGGLAFTHVCPRHVSSFRRWAEEACAALAAEPDVTPAALDACDRLIATWS